MRLLARQQRFAIAAPTTNPADRHRSGGYRVAPPGPEARRAWFEAAQTAHHRELLAHCCRLTGNVADDLVQETFLRTWEAREAFEGRASARTWLYRIATNAFLDTRKATTRTTAAPPWIPSSSLSSPP
ncbi:sigma factor [Phytomonospora endophytica]|uniref:RNA polymerase sigma factor n=1 Tax=Phytomonospora endophytica TaxID=714109 RepID=A0A841FUY6_9ACTN|nr:sigma factor [Phytomonospora endophytica]MBB6037362.1 DNA-directed RNA polymerase specialized sigma24 family protein [Phytomonospora endophytica]GIG69896.1 hypothetical protein Pen01_61910 [Phytomonospora endophytica]